MIGGELLSFTVVIQAAINHAAAGGGGSADDPLTLGVQRRLTADRRMFVLLEV